MIFTIEEARACLERVRELTQAAVEEVSRLTDAAEGLPPGGEEQRALAARAQDIINEWARSIVELGAEAKGLWLVDFDSGDGYFCWKYPEDTLDYFHGYEDGFAGRRLITPEILH